MDQTNILFPMAALAALTFAVLLMIPYKRFKAGRSGRVAADDFKFGESQNVPPDVSIPNRNFINLLEMPVLFYVACLTLYVTKNVDATVLIFAWLYFAFRVGHTLVNLTYNKVFHRLTVYAASNVILAVMWIRLFQALIK